MTLIMSYLGLGIVAGLLGGMLGVGGGIVVVPALIWIFRQEGVQPDVLTHLASLPTDQLQCRDRDKT